MTVAGSKTGRVYVYFNSDDSKGAHVQAMIPELSEEFQYLDIVGVDVNAVPEERERSGLSADLEARFYHHEGSCEVMVDFSILDFTQKLEECSGYIKSSPDMLHSLVNKKPIMLFMKGSPSSPYCGFSKQIVLLLKDNNVLDYGYFDILKDERVRQELKSFSNWPTYPQLYANGILIGGLDIARELAEEGSLRRELGL